MIYKTPILGFYPKIIGGTVFFSGFCMEAAGALLDPRASLMSSGTDLVLTTGMNFEEGAAGDVYKYYLSQFVEPLFEETVNGIEQGFGQANRWFWNTPVGTGLTQMKDDYNNLLNSLSGQQQ